MSVRSHFHAYSNYLKVVNSIILHHHHTFNVTVVFFSKKNKQLEILILDKSDEEQ